MQGVLVDTMVAGAWKSTVNPIILPHIKKSPVALWHLQTFGSLGREDSAMKVQTVEVVTYFANILYWLMKASICVLRTCNIFAWHSHWSQGHAMPLWSLFSLVFTLCTRMYYAVMFYLKCLITFVRYFVSYSQSSHMKLAPSWVAFRKLSQPLV